MAETRHYDAMIAEGTGQRVQTDRREDTSDARSTGCGSTRIMRGRPRIPAHVPVRILTCLLLVAAATVHALAPPAPSARTEPIPGTTVRAPQTQAARAEPEAASGWRARAPVAAHEFLAVTANPHATRAAVAVLERGGHAVDAAIAAQMVLGLVEPQSSGIGGGAFLVLYDAASGRAHAFDGRETAPAQARPELFLHADGTPMDFFEAAVGGRAVGAPGVVGMLEQVHRRFGRLDWERLFEPAIRLARDGFAVSARLHALLDADPWLPGQKGAADLYLDRNGHAWPPGYRLRNPVLADTLARIARDGSAALREGPIADDIVTAVRTHPNPGMLSTADLAAWQPLEREPLCFRHGRYRICGMPPPSSGTIALAQMLAFWQLAGPVVHLSTPDGTLLVDGMHRFIEAERLAFADRAEYVADTDFVALPGQAPGEAVKAGPGTLLDPAYLQRRARRIGPNARPIVAAGHPRTPPRTPLRRTPPQTPPPAPAFEPRSTTHLSIVDRDGNIVSMTSSIENAFGSRLLVRGFLLNNQLTDFSFVPQHDGRPVANRLQPGKRPRSSMSPLIVFDADSGQPVLVLGSPGGPAIISYVARTLISLLDDGVGLGQTLAMPNFGSRQAQTVLERARVPAALADRLAARGHDIHWREMTSGLHVIRLQCGTPRDCVLEGAADPRREGLAAGQ